MSVSNQNTSIEVKYSPLENAVPAREDDASCDRIMEVASVVFGVLFALTATALIIAGSAISSSALIVAGSLVAAVALLIILPALLMTRGDEHGYAEMQNPYYAAPDSFYMHSTPASPYRHGGHSVRASVPQASPRGASIDRSAYAPGMGYEPALVAGRQIPGGAAIDRSPYTGGRGYEPTLVAGRQIPGGRR